MTRLRFACSIQPGPQNADSRHNGITHHACRRRTSLPPFRPLFLAVLLAWHGQSIALPQGHEVVRGQGSMETTGAGMVVNQVSQKMVVKWDSFDIGANESVSFQQPAGGMALNRIESGSRSNILGRLHATGQLFITNPNGILFGPQAQVNVGGLVASTAVLNDDDFMAGNLRFTGNGASVSIINQGKLTAQERGYIALLAPHVINEGVVSARLGTALLAAGEDITISFADNGMLNYRIDRGTLDALVSNGELVIVDGQVKAGLIKADGGRIFMGARAARQMGAAVVNNEGVAEALTVQKQAGEIRLMGDMERGSVTGKGRLDASAPAGGDGGFIETSAARVNLGANAEVTAHAPFGRAGSWLIDPTDYLLDFNAVTQDGSARTVLNSLRTNDVTITTSGPGTDQGVITVDGNLSWGNGHTLTLIADTDIVLKPNTVMSLERQNDFGPELSYGNLVLKSGFGGKGKGTIVMGENATITRGRFGSVGIPGDYGRVTLYYTPASYAAPELPGMERISAKTLTSWLVVSTPEQLQAMNASAASLKSNFAMVRSIDASGTKGWNDGAGFMPVGDRTTPFTGMFDGMGNTISNLFIFRPESVEGTGLFGQTRGARITGVGLIDANVTGGFDATGTLAGLFDGYMADAWVSGQAQNAYAGSTVRGNGLGFNHEFGAGSTGGLVGSNRGTMLRTYSDAAVNGRGQVGGLAGKNFGSIQGSYSTGAVTGETGVGGLVGGNDSVAGFAGAIDNSYSTGAVRGHANVGNLVGENNGALSNVYSRSTSVTTDTASGNAGGLVGLYRSGPLSGALLWDTGSSALVKACGCDTAFGTGLASDRMVAGLNGLDPAIWRIYAGHTAPLLRSFLRPVSATFSDGSFRYNGEYASAAPYIGFSDADAVLGRNIFGAHLDEVRKTDGTYEKGRNAYRTYIFDPQLYSNQKGYDIQGPETGTVRVTIDPRSIQISALAAGKEYDGNTSSTTGPAADYLGKGDTLAATQSYDNPNASKGADDIRTLSVNSGYRIYFNGEDVTDNYLIRTATVDTSQDARVVITPRKVVFNSVQDRKTYDGYDTSKQVRQDLVGGDYVTGQQSFDTENAGDRRMVFKNGFTVMNNGQVIDGSNYSIQTGETGGLIDKAVLTLTATLSDEERAGRYYDGTVTANGPVLIEGLVIGHNDTVDTSAMLDRADAGQRQVQVGYKVHDGTDTGSNYDVKTVFAPLTVLRRPTTINAVWDSKPYDRNDSSKGKPNAGNAAPGQALVASQRFATVNASTSVATLVNDGYYFIDKDGKRVDAGNYAIAAQDVLPGMGSITRKAVTASAQAWTKTYDGNTSSVMQGKLNGIIDGDVVTVEQEFDSRNAGSRKLRPTTLTQADGHANYVIEKREEADGYIDRRSLTISANPYAKTYDGNTGAAGFHTGEQDVVGGDTVVASTGFQTADALEQQIVVKDFYVRDALTGAHSENYQVQTVSARGSISKKPLDVAANDASKNYDGRPFSGGNGVRYTGFVNGEDSSVLGGALSYGGSAQGAVNPGRYGIAAGGLEARNYTLSYTDGALQILDSGVISGPGTPSDPLLPTTALPLSEVIGIARLDGTGLDGFGKTLSTIDRLARSRNGEDYKDEDERLQADSASRNLDLRIVDEGMRLPAGLH